MFYFSKWFSGASFSVYWNHKQETTGVKAGETLPTSEKIGEKDENLSWKGIPGNATPSGQSDPEPELPDVVVS